MNINDLAVNVSVFLVLIFDDIANLKIVLFQTSFSAADYIISHPVSDICHTRKFLSLHPSIAILLSVNIHGVAFFVFPICPAVIRLVHNKRTGKRGRTFANFDIF